MAEIYLASQRLLLILFYSCRNVVLCSSPFIFTTQENQTLKELILANNRLEETSARFLKDGIQENDRLEILDLSWNHFKTKGAVAIAEGLQVPSTFTHRPSTFTLQPSTITLQPSTFTPQPSTLTLRPSTFTLRPSTFTLRPSTITLQTSTFTPRPSTFTL